MEMSYHGASNDWRPKHGPSIDGLSPKSDTAAGTARQVDDIKAAACLRRAHRAGIGGSVRVIYRPSLSDKGESGRSRRLTVGGGVSDMYNDSASLSEIRPLINDALDQTQSYCVRTANLSITTSGSSENAASERPGSKCAFFIDTFLPRARFVPAGDGHGALSGRVLASRRSPSRL